MITTCCWNLPRSKFLKCHVSSVFNSNILKFNDASAAFGKTHIICVLQITLLCFKTLLKFICWACSSVSERNYFNNSGAFLKTQRKKNIGHKDTNLCLFNPIFNPIICMLVIKHKFAEPPPHVLQIYVRTYLWHIFSSPPSTCRPLPRRRAARRRCTPPLLPLSHAAAPRRRHLAHHRRMQPPHAVLRRLHWQFGCTHGGQTSASATCSCCIHMTKRANGSKRGNGYFFHG